MLLSSIHWFMVCLTLVVQTPTTVSKNLYHLSFLFISSNSYGFRGRSWTKIRFLKTLYIQSISPMFMSVGFHCLFYLFVGYCNIECTQ